LKSFAIKNKVYILGYFTILLYTTVLLLISNSEHISININHWHNPFLDWIMKQATHLGEGWLAVPVCLLIIYKDKRLGFAISVICIASALITQFNKHFVFDNALRPSILLKQFNLHFVEGVEMLGYHSFPSGHTTAAFAVFTTLAFIYPKSKFQIVFLFLALLTAFSRIYLLQHFLRDTVVGSLIGFATAFLLYWVLIERKQSSGDVKDA
jgi:membrane-associated phospholipid phosphatase